MKATENKTIWTKIGFIKEMSLIAKTVIMFGNGCFLEFVNLSTGQEHHHIINNHKVNGDGVKCFVGHPSLYVFAYCEMCQNPDIYLKSYPHFEIIATFSGISEGYKCLAFSDGSVFFALGEMPHYTVSAWNWRSKEKIAESTNELLYEEQIIRCSYGRPMYLVQFGVGSNKLFIWDVFIVGKSVIFAKHEVNMTNLKPAPFQNVVWAVEYPSLFIIDNRGNIYTVDRDFCLEMVIDASTSGISGSISPSICWYQHGLIVSGPNQEIRHYKKVAAEWIRDWSYPTKVPIYNILSGKHDKCLGRTDVSEIVSFGLTEESVNFVRKGKSGFEEICVLNPTSQFFVVKRTGYHLDLYRILTGEIISTIVLKNNILSIKENPMSPFIAAGHNHGIISLISFYNELNPNILIELHLAEFDLITTRFFEHGHILVTGNQYVGEFFILKCIPGTQIEVVVHIQIGRQVTDYMLVSSQNMIRFFVIPVTQNQYYAGNQVIRYCVVAGQVVNIKEFRFENDQALYRSIMPKIGTDGNRMFYLIPHLSRHIELVESKRGNSTITIVKSIQTGHQIKRFLLSNCARNFVTWGYDGFIFIRCSNFEKVEGMALSHHRNRQGVKTAIINASATIIVSLGNENVLVATHLAWKPENEEYVKMLHDEMARPKIAPMFKTLDFHKEDRFAGKCWKEIQRLKTNEAEEEECKIEKNKILKEFKEIQETLTKLVTENYEALENKQLDLLEFYLDTFTYQKKQQDSKEDCKRLETYLRDLITEQDQVSNCIIEKYYLTNGVQWDNTLGIFSVSNATNYCLLPEDLGAVTKNAWFEEQRKIENHLNDTFEPWQPMTPKEIQTLLKHRPVPPKNDYIEINNVLTLKEENDILDLDSKIALQGSVSQSYVRLSVGHYQQNKLTTYYQCEIQQEIAEMDILKLKKHYNESFQITKALKNKEMCNIKEKNARLRQIVSEYNYFSEQKISLEIKDPEWKPIEKVETDILQVHDYEVPVRPYISPSEQAILDAKATEEERLRLMHLGDDFREIGLTAMMNGVLEVRWEDELRKDIPKPDFMLKKIPEEFTEEERKLFRDYEEKLHRLKMKRENYKNCLEAEFGQLSLNLRDSIRKFNQKLYDCIKYKFYIDQGINQENLIINKQRMIHDSRIKINQKECEIINGINKCEFQIENNSKALIELQEALVESRINLETMQAKEKQLEKAYKKDFQDISPIVHEQSYKLYKKRPKISFRTIITATLLNELARSIATNETSFVLTQDCLDYIKALDHLDMFAGLPPTIDENTWNLICKHRRLYIEFEIRLRAAQLQIQEGEATIAIFQKRVVTKKEKVAQLTAKLEQIRGDRLALIHNKPIQFVFKQSLVEIPLTGDLYEDFKDAILVNKSEIEHVNHLIVEAGKLKLKTIQQNMSFRRKMMANEWEHTRLRMIISDLIEQKKDIEKVKFTKEMQTHLRNKGLGREQDVEAFESDIKLVAAAYETETKDKKDKVMKLQRQLKSYQDCNTNLDQVIKNANVELGRFKLEKDYNVEEREKEILQARICGMLQRNQLVRKIQQNHNEILVLQAELELLRLKTFPTFKYKVLNE